MISTRISFEINKFKCILYKSFSEENKDFSSEEKCENSKENYRSCEYAANKSQITSEEQRMRASSIIQSEFNVPKLNEAAAIEIVEDAKPISNEEKFEIKPLKLPVALKVEVKQATTVSNVHEIIEPAVMTRML